MTDSWIKNHWLLIKYVLHTWETVTCLITRLSDDKLDVDPVKPSHYTVYSRVLNSRHILVFHLTLLYTINHQIN